MSRQGPIGAGFSAGALALLSVLCPPLGAIELRAGQQVIISENELIEDDLYVSGEVVTVNGIVKGDIVAVGREVVFNGSVLGDLIAAGQAVVVNGEVGDDVRIAGMALRVGDESAVGDDLLSAGFSLETSADSLVVGSVIFNGFQALLAGEVRQRLVAQSTALRLEGTIAQGGEVRVEGHGAAPSFMRFIPSPVVMPDVPSGLSLGPKARIEGKLIYTSPEPVRRDDGSRAPELTHIVLESGPPAPGFGERAVRQAKRWISILVVGVVLLLLASSWLSGRADELRTRPLATAAGGLLGLVGIPVALALVFATLILLSVLFGVVGLNPLVALVLITGLLIIAFVILATWTGLFLIGPAIAAIWLGSLLELRRQAADASGKRGIVAISIGCAVLAIFSLVPIVGGLVVALAAVLGFGALLLQAFRPLFRSAW